MISASDKGSERGSDDQTTVTDESWKVKGKTPRKSAVIPAQPSVEVDATLGPWQWFRNKGNSSIVQRQILPWLIAVHGIEVSKQEKWTVRLPLICQQMIAICDERKAHLPLRIQLHLQTCATTPCQLQVSTSPFTFRHSHIAQTMRAAPQSGLCVFTGEMCGMSSLPCSRSL